jgi:PAS domain S-box-containing protein
VAPDRSVLRANAEWLRSAGFTLDEVIGANIVDLFPETRDAALALHARARAGHRVEVPPRAQRVQGRETWWEGSIAPVPMEGGTGLLITAREVASASPGGSTGALRRDPIAGTVEQQLEAAQHLQELSTQLIQADDIQALYERILDTAIAIMRADCASIQMLDRSREHAGELRLLGHRGFSADAARFWEWVPRTSRCASGAALCSGERVIVPDVAAAGLMAGSDDREMYIKTRIRAVQATPLLSRSGAVIGMISTHWRAVHAPARGELRMLDVLARQAADLIDSKRTEEALRESEERLRLALKSAELGAWDFDPVSGALSWSERCKAVFGLPPDAPVDYRTFLDRLHPDDRQRVNEVVQQALDPAGEGRFEMEYRARWPDGAERWLSASGQAFFTEVEGARRATRFIGTVRDVTGRKRGEERVRRQNTLLAGMARIFQGAMTCRAEEELGRACLAVAEEVTRSKFGFIGQLNCRTGRLDHIAISDPGWEHCWTPDTSGRGTGFEMHGIYGRVLLDGKGFFTNDPPSHPDGVGTPPGHPPLTAFLSVPLVHAGETAGMLGLGNAEGGYGPEDLEAAATLATTIVQAFQRKRAEDALRESEERLRHLGDNLPESALYQYAHERDGSVRFHYVSAGIERLNGVRAGDVLRDPGTLHRQIPAECLDRLVEAEAVSARDLSDFDMEVPTHRPDGQVRWMWLHSRPRRLPDGRTMWDGVQTDVTERRQMQQALIDSDRRKSEFLAMLSHELRNPLAPIRNSLYLLDGAPSGSEMASRAREVIQRQTEHLTRLVDDLLDVTRISRGKIELHRERLDARELVRRACDDHGTLFHGRRLRLCVETSDPAWIDADETRIAQVVGNLLQNAAKFGQEGGVVTVGVGLKGGWAEIRVRDDGVGIAPDLMQRLFEPFVQADRGLARTKGGLGLGLALVKGLVEMHGGSVHVRSEGADRGAEFVVRLPGAPAPEEPAAALASPAAARPVEVLVIEDNVDAAHSIADVLELEGHRVHVATDGRTGIAKARQLEAEVILCDIGLPDMSGYEVARAIRAHGGRRAARLIALSGYAQPEDVRRARDAGFDAHIPKPPPLDALLALVAAGAGWSI